MKKISYGVLVLVLVVGMFALDNFDVLSGKANAEVNGGNEANLVTVNGSGTVKVKPDVAYINIGAETFNEDAVQAQAENSKIMDRVMKEINEAGIKDEDVKTISYNIYKTVKQVPNSGYEKQERVEGYNVRNIVEITVRDIKNIGKIVDDVSGSGANSINNIRFGVSKENEYYNEALKTAMKDAKAKAESIASSFGATIDRPYSIAENSYSSPVVFRESAMKYGAEMADAYNTPIESGELEITARVMVKYKY